MIEQIWTKKIVVIIQMNEEDVCDEKKPLPLITKFAWNAYLGFYYDLIINYFQMNAPFPYRKQQFHLTFGEKQNRLQSFEIVSHIIQKYDISLDQPVKLKCHFRSREQIPQIDLRRHYKNNLKASTALRYGKYGASILTVEMSINNVEDMVDSFRNMNFTKFIGSNNFQSDCLGYMFLVHRAQKIPLKFVHQDIMIERASEKQISLLKLAENTFGEEISKELKFKIHLVGIENTDIKMSDLQKYCHPDGYLYIHI